MGIRDNKRKYENIEYYERKYGIKSVKMSKMLKNQNISSKMTTDAY